MRGGGEGGRTFRNFRRQGGVKMFMLPVVGFGYFLESPDLQRSKAVKHTFFFIFPF